MSTIVTRAGKGSALTHNEVDANFTNLNTDKIEAAQSVTLTNKTISGSNNTLSNIGNSSLTNSSVTIGSTSVSLGSTATTVSGLTLSSPTVNTPTLSGGTINNASVGATTPSSGAFTTLSATGVTTVQAGTAAAPAITTSGDTNTGIFYPAADTVAIGTGGTEALRVNSSQTLTFVRSTLASYQWTAWNPSDIIGTTTTAPSTGTTDDSNYVTMSNSSGTLTVTFDVAGTYLVCINGIAFHANAYIYDTFYTNFGGTATRRIGRDDPNNWGDGTNDGNMSITTSFYVSATASQTLTIQPRYRVSAGGGTASQHTAYCNATIQYCGG